MTTVVPALDGRRRLAVEEFGAPGGYPVFLLHGTPGSRLGPIPRATLLHRLDIRLISFDRPGYGGSERRIDRVVGDIADDVRQIADHLELSEFAVLGRSGGGPHALACAALLPARTSRAAVLVGLAPAEARGLDWFEGMTAANILEYQAVRSQGHKASARLRSRAERIMADPGRHIADLHRGLTQADRQTIADPRLRAQLLETYTEAFRSSADGWIDDLLAFCVPWGFDPADIKIPVLLWHGANDTFSPVGHSRWLAQEIPNATLRIAQGVAHFGAFNAVPDVLTWLAGPTVRSPRL